VLLKRAHFLHPSAAAASSPASSAVAQPSPDLAVGPEQPSAGARDERAGAQREGLPMTHLKAFIVEDSPVIRENLVAALEEMAPIVVVGTAEDELGALSWLADSHNRCDLVVVDIFLKSGSGLGVLKAAATGGVAAKLVVLSNYATPDMRRKCLELGADRVFDKSNEIDALILYCCRLADGSTGSSEYNPLS
jgi:CheY-like chemotaxis protein